MVARNSLSRVCCPGLAGPGSESAIDVKAARRFAEQAATPRAYMGSAGEKTSNKYLRYYSAMEPEAHAEDSLLSPGPITAAADRSESEFRIW